MDHGQRYEFHEALLDANTFEDLPGKWQAAILQAEKNRPHLRVIPSPRGWAAMGRVEVRRDNSSE